MTLSAVDALYQKSGQYASEEGRKYLARLRTLSSKHVDLWVEKFPVYESIKDDAVLSIVLIDAFFAGDRLDEEKFVSHLKP